MRVVIEDGIDAGLAWHFGNPVAEARLLTSGGGVVDLRNREVVEVSGADRLAFLHALTTQHLESLPAGEATTALILSPTGHVEHVLYGTDDGTSFLAWTEPGHGDALSAFLDSMRFAMRVEVRRREDLHVVWAGHLVELDPAWRVRDSDLGGVEAFLPVGVELPDTVGMWAFEAMRIAAGVPRVFVDTDHRTIPNEIGLVGTHLTKGCYRGQETVARVHTLGRPPRRLVQLHLDGSMSELPAVGAPLELDGRQVGFVGSSARHHELGPIALALVKRSVPVDAELVVAGIAAAQEPLVDPEVGLHVRPVLG
ncbi:CAF17-like 4Fe-4S cluster assembly/insertion protein YgfZ [Tessaracoccus lacteus]|uniref:Glycine cleavage T C-terminal barrel domain-containing protein n=1 Tax=Tessaracoccus lacteus TaxID=3041766 RepID=A0ABY8PZ31_9ACTN|nr:glycine cleavage T C-terminal barrel domain-containing protein [Tessaracoccus sp. T21]WGT47717.1 glycine cleavage T C-terminal barrel domain-containing protein [Tessaracoccus sp. T21]